MPLGCKLVVPATGADYFPVVAEVHFLGMRHSLDGLMIGIAGAIQVGFSSSVVPDRFESR
jgi:hypothetical protein